MRYEKGHKDATRQKIVETATAEFRRNGINGIGVAEIMSRAGLTHGGFYSHFSSKDDLVRATLDEAWDKSRMIKNAQAGMDLEGLIRAYLRPEHRDHPERGCAIASLVSELGRNSQETRSRFTENLDKLLALIETKLPEGSNRTARKETAMGIFATIMGALQLSRTVNDPKLSNQFIEAGIQAALKQTQP